MEIDGQSRWRRMTVHYDLASTLWILIAVLCTAGLGGCADVSFDSTGGGNHAERDINLYAKVNGYSLSNVRCPMKGDRDDYDGKTIACTADIALTDGSTKAGKIDIAYEKCSLRHTCQNIDLTGDVRVRVRP